MIKKPRDYQLEAINNVVKGFNKADRGQLILPCGAGKTLVAMWIAQKMQAKRILVLVPSLSLLKQIKDEWISEGLDLPRLCVCSQQDIDTDSISYKTDEIDSNVTTDPYLIAKFTKNESFIIYSTYQSSDCLSQGVLKSGVEFDLVICDEAHKTAGSKVGNSAFVTVHDNAKIPAFKRLYMTATPRILKIDQDRKTKDCFCMDNESIFGHEFHNMSFKQAIEKNILVDYQIVAIGVSRPEIQRELERRSMSSSADSVLQIAHNYALEKFMRQYKARHAITFHSSVVKAKTFASNHASMFGVKTYHVNGKQTATERKVLMNQFESDDYAVMTNARCLTEGVDIPCIDAVYFCDPKNSKIDVIQAAGRALRRSDRNGKKLGYIVVPLFHSPENDIEKMVDASLFSNLMSIIRSIGSQDGRLADGFKYNDRVGRSGKIKFGGANFIVAEDARDNNDPLVDELKESLYSQLLKKFKTVTSEEFEAMRKKVRKHRIPSQRRYKELKKLGWLPDCPWDPSTVYKHCGWVSWGDFLGNKNIATQDKKFLPYEEAKALITSMGIKSMREYRDLHALGKLPSLPSTPHKTYKEWSHWGDFLGTGQQKVIKPKLYSYEEVKKMARDLNIQSRREYNAARESGKLPPGCPHKPERYVDWVSWDEFLGKRLETVAQPEPLKEKPKPKIKEPYIELVARKQRLINKKQEPTLSLEERVKLIESQFEKARSIA